MFETDRERFAAANIFRKLVKGGYWGCRPLQDTTLFRYAKTKTGDVDVELVLKILVNDNVILVHHSKFGGKRYSLNTRFKKEILEFMERYLS